MSRDADLIKEHYGVDIDSDPAGLDKLMDILNENDVAGECKEPATGWDDED